MFLRDEGMKISLADRLGNVKKVRVGFSFAHFFTGPLYCCFRLKFFTALFECLYLFYLLPIPGMNAIVDLIGKMTFVPAEILSYVERILLLFRLGRNHYYFVFGIFICLVLHTALSFRIRSAVCKRLMKKKQLLPLEEIDARKLIKYRVADENIQLAETFDIRRSNTYKSAEENWYENNQNRLNRTPSFENRSTLSLTMEERKKTRIEQVENSYRLGLITRSEYEKKMKYIKEKK